MEKLMPLVTLVVVLCNALSGPPLCLEEIMTDSAEQPMTLTGCSVLAQRGIPAWMNASWKYRQNWVFSGYKCVEGPYVLKVPA
jgi:hypothetical protein